MKRNLKIIFLFISYLLLAIIIIACNDYIEPYVKSSQFNNSDSNGNEMLSQTSEFIIVIPDIQYYTYYSDNHKYLISIIDRIIEIRERGYIIKAVLQVGDLTEQNTQREWSVAKQIFSKLDQKIDYILCTGNHDYGDNGTCNNRNTFFSQYFTYNKNTSYIGSYEENSYENSYFHIEIHDQPFQIFSLEFGPRDKVVDWAKKISNDNNDKLGILITHAYLFKNKERFDWANLRQSQNSSPYNYAYAYPDFGKEKVNDGQGLWEKFIIDSNIRFVMCGHKTTPDYIGNLLDENRKGNEVLQMLFNTQNFPNGGDGWIQFIEFFDDKKTVQVRTYSAVNNIWWVDDTHNYIFQLNK
jgi:hypothetical protein